MGKDSPLTKSQRDKLFQKNCSTIMSFHEWKAIKDKTLKMELLRNWRSLFPDKEIRDSWGVKPGTFYYQLNQYGLKGSGESAEKTTTGPDNISKHVDQSENNNAERIIIEAEYSVTSEEKSLTVSSAPESTNHIRMPIMSFKESGSPERIMRRLEAIAANLKLEEGELDIKIEIFRKN